MRPIALALYLVFSAGAFPAASATAATVAPPSSVPRDSLSGARHHALELPLMGFYAVFLPSDFDASGRKKYPLCVILHGSGSDELSHGLGMSGDVGLDGIIYIAPRAPYPHYGVFMEHKEAGWTAWPEFPPEWGNRKDSTFPKSELAGLDPVDGYSGWIARCIRDARGRYPVEDGKAVVIGHSQGAAFAHYFSVRHPDLVKAYAAYAGAYKRSLESDSAGRILKSSGIHSFIFHGEADSTTPAKESRDFVAYLEKHGAPHSKAWYPGMGHGYGGKSSEDLRKFVAKWCLGKAPPARKGILTIQGLARASLADSLGLKPGDRIKEYDGKSIRTREELKAAVEAAAGKPEIKLTIERGGKPATLTAKPGRLSAWVAER